ncbi:unnamed protein product [Somion occarium]|uniref:Uncharacterized protein n=1 Tax=Somion occarium TaxID=3059160 RepID=A0ABP1DIV3_9APHY
MYCEQSQHVGTYPALSYPSLHFPPSSSFAPQSAMDMGVDRNAFEPELEYTSQYPSQYHYATSSIRYDDHPSTPSSSRQTSPEVSSHSPQPPPPGGERAMYAKPLPSPHPDYLGVNIDGTITADHPLVDLYINAVPPKRNHVIHPLGYLPDPDRVRKLEPQVPPVDQLINMPRPLTGLENEIIFALAALKVYYNARHPKHFSFWTVGVRQRTLSRIQWIMDLKPCPIQSPVAWMDKDAHEGWLRAHYRPEFYGVAAVNGRYNTRNGGNNKGKEKATAPTRTQPKRAKSSRKKVAFPVPAVENSGENTVVEVVEGQNVLPRIVVSPEVATKEGKLERMASPAGEALAQLPELGLSPLTITPSSSATAVIKRTRVTTSTTPAPVPSRRSARQAHKRPAPAPVVGALPTTPTPPTLPSDTSPSASASATASGPSSSDSLTVPLPVEEDGGSGERPAHKRSRSNSSATSGTSTLVSDGSTAVESSPAVELVKLKGLGLELDVDGDVEMTVVKADVKAKGKGKAKEKASPTANTTTRGTKRKRGDEEEQEQQGREEGREHQEKPTRASTRARKTTARATARATETKQENKPQEKKAQDKADKVGKAPPAKKAKTVAKGRSTSGRKTAISS